MFVLTRAKAPRQHIGSGGRRNNEMQQIIYSATEGSKTHHCTPRHHFRLCAMPYLMVC